MFSRNVVMSRPNESDPMILIVEDEPVARKALSRLLESKGYPTKAVRSAEDALRLLRDGPHPEVALVDLDLPGMSGLDFISRLEAIDPNITSILVTASSLERVRRLKQDADVEYVRKPLDFDKLLSLISERQLPH
jgi:CheY-like chemotaxis protein